MKMSRWKDSSVTGHKQYLISLYRTRSVVALFAGIAVFCCTLSAIAAALEHYPEEDEPLFHYFTVLSNLLSSAGAAFMVPYAVEGVRKKRFVLPRWVVLFQYSGATCVAITMVTAVCILLPATGIRAMTGMNFWLHLVTPLLTVVLFQCVESGVSFTRRDTVLALIPYWLYMAVYFVMVVLVGEERGGWEDIYSTQKYIPVWASILLMLTLGYAVAALLRRVQNRRAADSRRRLSQLWSEDMEPTELKIEAFGLGRYMGQFGSDGEVVIPMDIFELMAERYDVTLPELARAYIKGVLDSAEEKKRNSSDGESA